MDKIRQGELIVQELFKITGIPITTINIVNDHELQTVVIDVKTPQHGLFSYNSGELSKAMNHILRILLEKSLGEDGSITFNCMLDVNGEQSKRLSKLKTHIRSVVDSVRETSNDIELEPMTPYDRLLIHTLLSTREDIGTESIGEGVERRVVIKLLPKAAQ